jgi:hypothetical protein
LSPFTILITFVPYGCGALVARELVIRSGKGWASLLLLGIAFSLIFEGIVTRVMFNPMWAELGPLAVYQHVYGVNWTLSLALAHFHVALSIFAAITLTEMLYPDRRYESWISTRMLFICAAALPAWTLVIGLFERFIPPLWGVIGLLGLTALLIALALRIPAQPFASSSRTAPPPWLFGVVGASSVIVIMFGVYIIPAVTVPPPLPVSFTVLLAIDVFTGLWLVWASGGGTLWDDRHRLALITGLLAFFIAFGFWQDIGALSGTGDEKFVMRSVVSVGTIWGLRRMWQYVNAQGKPTREEAA